jgi:head-tail adaptor
MGWNEQGLASLRRRSVKRMPETAIIQSETTTDDGSGGTESAWEDGATTKCRISRLSKRLAEIAAASGLEVVKSYMLSFPLGTVINEAQRVKVGARLFYVGYVDAISYPTDLTVIGVERGNG